MNPSPATSSCGPKVRLLPCAVTGTALVLALAACGGGGGGEAPPAGPISNAQRASAATTTAQSASNACTPIQPFYWEVGDRTASLATGSAPSGGGAPAYTGASIMNVASASKWIYGAYVVQLRQGALTADDVKYLTFHSGYTDFSRCLPAQSVDGCLNSLQNDVHSIFTDGKFSYGGGHMQKHASLIGLGGFINTSLAAEIRSQIGTDVALTYSQPQLAGGVVTSADAYAVFLRKILSGSLLMNAALGTHAVCTNPSTCADAINTPVPHTESYHYSIGHWVEDDPANGDGAFSSAGAFGFYPWIDAGKTWYGIVAREDKSNIIDPDKPDEAGHGFASAQCGQLIRKAWISGVAQ